MSSGDYAIKIRYTEVAGATRSMSMPELAGATGFKLYFDPASEYVGHSFRASFSYVPRNGFGSAADDRTGVVSNGYYDDTGLLWSEGFSVRLGGEVAIRVDAETPLPIGMALDNMPWLIDALGVRATGNSFANRLTGGHADDTLRGQGGDDILKGGAGDDVLSGGAGADQLTGGAGSDVFVFGHAADSVLDQAGRDVITEFTRLDTLDLSGIDANTRTRGDDAFDYIGREKYDGHAGQLRWADGTLKADLDGDGESDFAVRVGTTMIHESDMIL